MKPPRWHRREQWRLRKVFGLRPWYTERWSPNYQAWEVWDDPLWPFSAVVAIARIRKLNHIGIL